MAHELDFKADGTASMFSGEGITPWHGLGTVIEGLATAEEALALSGLDFTVTKEPIYQDNGDGVFVKIPDRFSTVRSTDKKSLGIVAKNYHVYNNAEAFAFLNSLTDTGSGDAVFTTAGALKGGSRTFITMRIGEEFTVRGDDAHQLYLMLTNSHDGTQSFTASVTPIRAVCANTVTMALAAAKTRWTVRHKSPLDSKVQNAREDLELAFKYQFAFEKEVEKLSEIRSVTKDKFYAIADKIVPESPRQHDLDVEAMMNIWEHEPTVTMGEDRRFDAWEAFNAVTYFTDHREYRTAESRFKAIIGEGVGTGYAEKMRPAAHKLLLALA